MGNFGVSVLIGATILLAAYLLSNVIGNLLKGKQVKGIEDTIKKTKKDQKERSKGKCSGFHSYVEAANMRVCEDCGFCSDSGLFLDKKSIKVQIEIDREIGKISKLADDEVDKVLKEKYNMSKEDLIKMGDECQAIVSKYDEEKKKIFKELSKDLE